AGPRRARALPWPRADAAALARPPRVDSPRRPPPPPPRHTRPELGPKADRDYTADRAVAIQLARDGKYQAAFLIAPTTAEELQAVVRGGELLPQKSTHFYPKLLDGLVFHRLGE